MIISGNFLSAQFEDRAPARSAEDSLLHCSWSYWIDSTNALSLSQVTGRPLGFRNLESDSLRISSEYTFWFTVDTIPNKAHYLHVGDYDVIEVYYRDEPAGKWKVEKNGRLIRPRQRSCPTPPYAIYISGADRGNTSLFVKIKNYHFFENGLIQPNWLNEDAYDQMEVKQAAKRRSHAMLAGILCGALLAFFIYPLILFFLNRRIFYLYYSLFILLSFFLYLFTFERYGHIDLLFSHYPTSFIYGETLLNTTSIAFYLLFLLSFLNIPDKYKWVRWYLGFMVVFQLSLGVIDFLVFKLMLKQFTIPYEYAPLAVIPASLIPICLIYVLPRLRDRAANLILAGVFFYILGTILSIVHLTHQEALQGRPIFENHFLFYLAGTIMEVTFFSFALGVRHRQLLASKIETQSRLEQLEELEIAKTRLYTNITHEFRTPLQVILGMADQIRREPRLEVGRRLNLIRKNGQNLLTLVNQMLDLAKLDAGRLELQLVQAEVVEYLKYNVELFRSAAEAKQTGLIFETGAPELIMDFDPERLRQILYNLLSNAVKFTPAGGEIICTAHCLPAASGRGNALEIRVKDTGPGMTEDVVARIFDRFYQETRNGEKGNRSGTGIGLAVVKELVALMGGTIAVHSRLRAGTEFQVVLPVRRTSRKASIETLLKERERDLFPTGPTVSASTVPLQEEPAPLLLLIEDNEDVLYYIHTLLGGRYHIAEARDGQEGVEKARLLVPDIIISDVMMPRLDGFELCRSLKQDVRTSHIPIVLLTAKAAEADKFMGIQYGADAYLTKPVNEKELILRLEALIELRRRIQQHYRRFVSDSVESLPADEDGSSFLKEIHAIVIDHIGDQNFGPSELCRAIGMSRTQLYRKLKALTNYTIANYIRSLRLHKARQLLKTTGLSIGEIAVRVGFNDQSYFSRTFSAEFGAPPSSAREKNKDL